MLTEVGFILKDYQFGEVLCLWATSIVIFKEQILVVAKAFLMQNTLSEFPKIVNQLQIEVADARWLPMHYIELYFFD